jgi:hypothetical protein
VRDVVRAVAALDTDEHEQARPDGADHPVVDLDPRVTYALQDGAHLLAPRPH